MKINRITSTALLGLLVGIVAPAYAVHAQQGEKQDHPDKSQAAQHEQARPEQQHVQQQEGQNKQQEHAQHQQQDQNKQQQHAQQQQQQNQQSQHVQQHQQQNQNEQHAQQHQGQNNQQHTQELHRVEQTAWQQHRTGNWQSEHRTWQQRGGYSGYRIPDNRFHGYFGPGHGFRIEGLPFLVVGGYPRFQYGGYWFSLVDPWPGYWTNNWYDTDDVYVNYVDNGYYLFNRRYPTVGIAISISM